MPKIPIPTAQRGPGVLQLPTADPRSFGVQAGQATTEFGQQLQQYGETIQHQQDKLDLANMAADYEVKLDGVKSSVLSNPDLSQHPALFDQGIKTAQEDVLKAYPTASRLTKQAFQTHLAGEHAKAKLDIAHTGTKIRAERAVADFTATEDRLMEKAALARDPNAAFASWSLASELRANMVRSGLLSETQAMKRKESAEHRYWNIFAQERPNELLDLAHHPGEGNAVIAGMDTEKRNVYINLAINTLHAQQSQANAAQAQLDKDLKRTQEENKAKLQADVMAGKPIDHGLVAQLVRDRQLDGDAVAPALALQSTVTQVPDMSRYQRGLATQMESQLKQSKYTNEPFDQAIFGQIDARYKQGQILHAEATHLMSVAGEVQTHKLDPSKSARNSTIAHAAANLNTVMESANKLTGFSAIGNQATAAANEYFYRRLEQEPDANPWAVMHEAETQFKPIVEKQQGVSKIDQILLNDAKVEANAKLGLISPAAARAYREQAQDERGRKAVNDALKALPPPPEPGTIERLWKKFVPSETPKPRKAPGVMGD